ncbi:MAG: NAD(P)-dependent oxidoreductase [Chloroflexi bacterium]|nr:NAD(P)-dependent oxidoreductase [Chloroflexota bacterium]
MADPLLVITGGGGRIASAIRPMLRAHYRLRLLDVRERLAELEGDEYMQLDTADLDATERGCAGADAVLHLAANASTSARWAEVRKDNIDATYNVFEAARRCAASKVVLASTNHVMGFYNLERAWPIDTVGAIRPDSLYGVSKAFGEALARYYADAFGMSMICLRIGWFTPDDPTSEALSPLWISARDLAQIVLRCLETPRRFGIYNATSNNPQAHWSLETARSELGYAPVDDVSVHAIGRGGARYVDPSAGVLGLP